MKLKKPRLSYLMSYLRIWLRRSQNQNKPPEDLASRSKRTYSVPSRRYTLNYQAVAHTASFRMPPTRDRSAKHPISILPPSYSTSPKQQRSFTNL